MPFAELLDYVRNLPFKQEPNYEKIDFMFRKIILDQNDVPGAHNLTWLNQPYEIQNFEIQESDWLIPLSQPQINDYNDFVIRNNIFI